VDRVRFGDESTASGKRKDSEERQGDLMTAADDYISRVLAYLPTGTSLRSQIEMELRAHIAERSAHGHSVAEVMQLLGDPRTLAESYLAAVPLVPATFIVRGAAKIVDLAIVVLGMAVLALILVATFWRAVEEPPVLFSIGMLVVLIGGTFTFAIYTVAAETRNGRTLGKRWFGLRVVTEAGTKISFGQALVRQLPMFMQIYWIDVLFALFTERSQRAFELLSKTRVVIEPPQTRHAA
jgi:uncharacterized RDD family membrane protein YckC